MNVTEILNDEELILKRDEYTRTKCVKCLIYEHCHESAII
jgi:hypothetical protein